ncbi:hypothetical protein I302_107736 [Kwoniella bestiolae CBS 10118]|uniref:Uncharacterized protein n=1 Tax=Kwoniella bestiolae CBS 10118 TaxID=1296100 RepID=A0A1B9FXN9_9TREE|nr:hypothetical protein I302_06525 [Kwoniella bestiolae CBS 10118]OCF23542.1 hypothetical protein I302_06525 [Kwoniella bestiolae CBS 10118]
MIKWKQLIEGKDHHYTVLIICHNKEYETLANQYRTVSEEATAKVAELQTLIAHKQDVASAHQELSELKEQAANEAAVAGREKERVSKEVHVHLATIENLEEKIIALRGETSAEAAKATAFQSTIDLRNEEIRQRQAQIQSLKEKNDAIEKEKSDMTKKKKAEQQLEQERRITSSLRNEKNEVTDANRKLKEENEGLRSTITNTKDAVEKVDGDLQQAIANFNSRMAIQLSFHHSAVESLNLKERKQAKLLSDAKDQRDG